MITPKPVRRIGQRSAATRPKDHPFPKAREAYLNGASLGFLRRRFKLNNGELRDVAPEEFPKGEITARPEGDGGY